MNQTGFLSLQFLHNPQQVARIHLRKNVRVVCQERFQHVQDDTVLLDVMPNPYNDLCLLVVENTTAYGCQLLCLFRTQRRSIRILVERIEELSIS